MSGQITPDEIEQIKQAMIGLGLTEPHCESNDCDLPGVCGKHKDTGEYCIWSTPDNEWYVWAESVGDDGVYQTIQEAIDELVALVETPEQTFTRLSRRIAELEEIERLRAERDQHDGEPYEMMRARLAAALKENEELRADAELGRCVSRAEALQISRGIIDTAEQERKATTMSEEDEGGAKIVIERNEDGAMCASLYMDDGCALEYGKGRSPEEALLALWGSLLMFDHHDHQGEREVIEWWRGKKNEENE